MAYIQFIVWSKKFIDQISKIDTELSQKKQVSDNGTLNKVIEEMRITYNGK